jgi:hypothetical protein
VFDEPANAIGAIESWNNEVATVRARLDLANLFKASLCGNFNLVSPMNILVDGQSNHCLDIITTHIEFLMAGIYVTSSS